MMRHRHVDRLRGQAQYLDRRIAEAEEGDPMHAARGQLAACAYFIALHAELRERGLMREIGPAVAARIKRHQDGDPEAVLW